MLQLILRSQFWGKTPTGHACKRSGNGMRFPHCLQKLRHVTAQVDFGDTRLPGCCAHWGQRVMEIQESHFLDYHRDEWDLYCYTSPSGDGQHHIYHKLILVSQSQSASTELKATQGVHKWEYLGECKASTMRLDIEYILFAQISQRYLQNWKVHHFHIDIFIDKLVDRTFGTQVKDKKKYKKRRAVLSEVYEQNK
jgi:hypothetical protein